MVAYTPIVPLENPDMNIRFQPNILYYGDCLDIMADFPDSCINLICLDPPFSGRRLTQLF